LIELFEQMTSLQYARLVVMGSLSASQQVRRHVAFRASSRVVILATRHKSSKRETVNSTQSAHFVGFRRGIMTAPDLAPRVTANFLRIFMLCTSKRELRCTHKRLCLASDVVSLLCLGKLEGILGKR
jgi:hypothetical protein